MAYLQDNNRPSQREIEGVLEDLDPIYRDIEDCEDSEALHAYASTLYTVAARLQAMASEWHGQAKDSEEHEQTCPQCGGPVADPDEFSGYCDAHCEDINN